MRVLINTLFHGDKKTKALLWGCVAAVLAGIALIAVFIFTMNFPLVIGAVISFLIPLVIIRNYDFTDHMGGVDKTGDPAKQSKKDEKKIKKKKNRKEEKHETAAEIPEKTKEKLQKVQKGVKTGDSGSDKLPEKDQGGLRKVQTAVGEAPLEETEKEGEGLQHSEKTGEIRKEAGEKVPEIRPQEAEGEEKSEKGSPEKPEPERKIKTADKLPAITKQSLKQLMVKYKVKREHRPVIIDSSLKWGVEKCPAYMWVTRGKTHFMLLEETPREIVIDTRDAVISYSVAQNPELEEYNQIRNNAFFMQMFGECLPSYRDEFINRRRVTSKPLYAVDDIKLTNTSARAAFDLIKATFELPEKYRLTGNVGHYTQEAYKTKVLWQDGVINTNEFKNRTKKLLQEMSEANISGQEYDKNLYEMVDRQLITREYADYYADAKK